MAGNKLYPELVIPNNEHPSRLLAFPIIGILIKIILLIPVFIEAIFLTFAYLFFWILTPFVILFTGKYWESAYNFHLGMIKFSTKLNLYFFGLTDKYPGFGLDDNGIFTLKIDKPTAPNRLLAFPLLGFIIRLILLIPYIIFASVLSYGSQVAVFFSWFIILFTGKYPESLYEFVRDTTRVSLANQVYFLYLSDTYPSFYISMKHKTIKILLIIAGSLLFLANSFSNSSNRDYSDSDYYNNSQDYNPGK